MYRTNKNGSRRAAMRCRVRSAMLPSDVVAGCTSGDMESRGGGRVYTRERKPGLWLGLALPRRVGVRQVNRPGALVSQLHQFGGGIDDECLAGGREHFNIPLGVAECDVHRFLQVFL